MTRESEQTAGKPSFGRFRQSLKSAGVLLVSQLFLQIGGPVVGLLLVRYLGPQEYGYYASAAAVTGLLAILADFGVNQTVLKHGSGGSAALAGAFLRGRAVALVLALVAFLAATCWLSVLDYHPVVVQLGVIFALEYFVYAYRSAAVAVLQNAGAYRRLAGLSVSSSVARWGTILLTLLLRADVRTMVCASVAASGVVTVVFITVWLKQYLPRGSAVAPSGRLRAFLHDVWVFGLGGAFYQIYYQSDAALLSAMRPPLEVGFYSVPFRLLNIIYVVPGVVFNQVLYPRYFVLSREDRRRYLRLYLLTSKLMLVGGSAIALCVWAVGEPVLAAVVGSGFAPASTYLLLLAAAVPFRFWASSTGAILTTDGLAEKRVTVQGGVAALNVALNLLFIPTYGALAAAVTTVVCDALLCLGYFTTVNRRSLRINAFSDLKVHYFAAALAGGALVAAGTRRHLFPYDSFASLLLAAVMVALLAYALIGRYVGEEEKAELYVRSARL